MAGRRRTFYNLNRKIGVPASLIATIYGMHVETVYRDIRIAADQM